MNNYQGDLADIVRASGGGGGGSSSTSDEPMIPDWKFPSELLNFPSGLLDELPSDDFGDPFSNMRDPLLHELDIVGSSSIFFNNNAPSNNNDMLIKTSSVASGYGVGDGGNNILGRNNIIIDEEMKRPAAAGCNIFSRMLQISPNAQLPIDSSSSLGVLAASPRREIIKTPALVSNDMINANSSKVCLIENAGLQISSPRNPGIKRRKSQSKQVVCIPAPAPANSRPTGEVVPSDLWAWRKYGQKPIKGSPYPRGYYRCSSSKGCSARKQVERSRADPNMLVITYTSEHNHPWPTQRNALAGSTRTQPSKSSTSASKGSPSPQPQKTTSMKEEAKDNVSSILSGSTTTTTASVKEEIGGDIGKEIDMDDGEFSEGFPQSYKPAMPADSYQPEDTNLYAGLGELEPDLLFNQGFSGDKDRESKALDPLFSMFDWSIPENNTSFGDEEAKEGFITRP